MKYVIATIVMLTVLLGILIVYNILRDKFNIIGEPVYDIEIIILLMPYVISICIALGFLYMCIRVIGYVPYTLFL